MAIDKFNSVDGFSTGFPPRQLADANGNVSANALTAAGADISGNTNVANLTANGNVTLGAIGNVHITGGTSGQIVSTDGNGNLSFTTPAAGVAGSNTQVQYNDAGNLAGAATLTFNKTNNVVTVANTLQANVLKVSSNVSNGANAISIQANATTNAYTLTLPTNTGSNGQAIVTDGTGKLSFANITAVGGSNTQVQYNDAGNLSGSANFTFNNTTNTLTVNNVSVGNTITSNTANTAFLNVANDAIVQGNLTVNGNVTYINSNVTNIEDPVIQIGGGPNGANLTSYDGKDRGVFMQNFSQGANAPVNEFMGYQTANGTFVLASSATVANNIVTVSALGNLKMDTLNGANLNATNVTVNLATANVGNITAVNANTVVANSANIAGNTAFGGNLSVTGNAAVTGNVSANYYAGNGINLTGVVHNAANVTTAVQYNVNGNFTGNANAFSYTDANTTLVMRGTPMTTATFTTQPQAPISVAYGNTSNGSYGNSYVIIDTKRNSSNTSELSPLYVSNTNGASWVFANANTSAQMRDVAFGNGWAIAVGINGTLSRSSDLATWNARAFGGNLTGNFTSVTYANVLGGPVFIAVGDSGAVATSSDNGQTWTQKTLGSSADLKAVIFDGSYFNIVGASGGYWYSSDGSSWNSDPVTDLSGYTLNDIAFNGQRQTYIVADGGYVAYSTPPSLGVPKWATRKISNANLTGITYSGSNATPWLAISAANGVAYISNVALNNGAYFDTIQTNLPTNVTLTSVASNGSGFIFTNTGPGVAYNGAQLLPNPSVGTVDADEANVYHLKVTGVAQLGDVTRVGIDGGLVTAPSFNAVGLNANGTVTSASIIVNQGGTGYDVPPVIGVVGTLVGANARPASITATVSGGTITGLTIVDGGLGYQASPAPYLTATAAPKFMRTDGTGNLSWYGIDVTAIGAKPGAPLYGVQFNNNGNFAASNQFTYNSNTNVLSVNSNATFTGGNVSLGAVANLHISGGNALGATLGAVTIDANGVVTNVAISNGGFGYTIPPRVTITGSNTKTANIQSVLDANGSVTSLTITSGGLGYNSNAAASASAPSGRYLQTDGNGNLSWTEVTGSGSGNGTPAGSNTAIQFNDNGTFGGNANLFAFSQTAANGATANIVVGANANLVVNNVSKLFVYGGNANAATLGAIAVNAGLGGTITSIAVATGGSGYDIAPTVTISGANTLPAQATAVLANGAVSSITINNAGSGYTSGTVTATISAPTTKYLKTDGNGNLAFSEVTATGNANVAGSNTQVQFNYGGQLGASNAFVFDRTTNNLSVGTNDKVTLVGTQGIANGVSNIGVTFVSNNGTQTNKVTISPSVESNANLIANWTMILPATAGANGNALITDGNGVTRWAQPFGINNPNGIATISANGQNNIITVQSIANVATTTIQGNLNVTGNINSTDVTSLSIQEPIINLGTNSNNKPLTTTDTYDRGQAYHFYNANLIQTTVNAAISSGSNLVTLSANSAVFANIATGQAFYANAANGTAIFPVGTTISNVDAANSRITVSTNATIAGAVSDGAYVGSDVLNFAGFDQSAQEFVFGTNVGINGFVTSIPANNYGNLRANNFIGSLANGNSNLTTVANSTMTFNVRGVNNVMTVGNTNVAFGSNVALVVTANNGTADRTVTIKGNTSANFAANYTLTLPPNAGASVPATAGAVTLDGNGVITAIAVGNVGLAYTIPPTVTITGGNTDTAVANTTLAANGSVSTINIIYGGLGYNSGTVSVALSAPSNKYLQTDGNGNLTWTEVISTGGNANVPNALVNGNSNVKVKQSGNVTISAVGNANIVTVTGNSVILTGNLSAPNASLIGNTTISGNANLTGANVAFNSPSSITIGAGTTRQFLQTSANTSGNVQWANGSIRYQDGNNIYTDTQTGLALAASAATTTVYADRELWAYTDTGLIPALISSAGTGNVVINGDQTAVLSTGTWVKFAQYGNSIANVYQVVNSTYNGSNTQIDIGSHGLITNTSSFTAYLRSTLPSWDNGNVGITIVPGVTQVVIGTNDQPANGTPTSLVTITGVSNQTNASTFGSVVTVSPPLSNSYNVGDLFFQFTSATKYIEEIDVGTGIAGNLDSSNTVLTLSVDTANIGRIANGNSNVTVFANNAVTISSNGQANIVKVLGSGTGNTANINANVNITGNVAASGNLVANGNGKFGNVLSYGYTKTNTFALAGSITGRVVNNAGRYVIANSAFPTVSLVGGGGTGAQVSATWSNATYGGNNYTLSGLSIVNPGEGYTSLPAVQFIIDTGNVSIVTPAQVTLTGNIGNISNVQINGGTVGQAIITDGFGNLSFGTVTSNYITSYGYTSANLAQAYQTTTTYSSGTANVVVTSILAGGNASQVFPVGSYVTFSNGATWNQVINTIPVGSNGNSIQLQLNATGLPAAVLTNTPVQVGNAEQPVTVSYANNISFGYTANTSGVVTVSAIPSGANTTLQFNRNGVFAGSNSLSFTPNATSPNAGGVLAVPNMTAFGSFFHTTTTAAGATFARNVNFLQSNYANGVESTVTFANVERIVIPGGSSNTASAGAISLDGNGNILSIAIAATGDGYTYPPVVTVTGANTTSANVRAVLGNGKVSTLTIGTAGSGYSSGAARPTTGGSGSGLTVDITANVTGVITSAVVNNGGSGYLIGDTVNPTGANTGVAGLQVANVYNGIVTGFTIANAGVGYSSGTIAVSMTAPTTHFLATDGYGNLSWQEANVYNNLFKTSPGGANTQVQFNLNGNFAGANTFVFDPTTNTMSLANTLRVGNANATSNITVGNGKVIVANVGNALVNTTITSNSINAVTQNTTGLASFYGNVAIGAFNGATNAVSNSNVTITGISVVVGNATNNTTIGNNSISSNVANVITLNVSGGANLGNVGNLKIVGGSNLQFLQTDGIGNTRFANGAFQYRQLVTYDITTFYNTALAPSGQSIIYLQGDAYGYVLTGSVLQDPVTAGDQNVFVAGDVTSTFQLASVIKLSANVGGGYYLDAVTFDSGNSQTILSNLAGFPAADAGNAIYIQSAGAGPLNGQQISFVGAGINDIYTGVGPTGYDYVNDISAFGISPSLANAVPAGANLYIAIPGSTSITEFVQTGNGISGNYTGSNRTLVLDATPQTSLANGNSNVNVIGNGNITFSSAGNANVVVITNDSVYTNNIRSTANILINGNTAIGNTTAKITISAPVVDLGPVGNVKIGGGANGQVLTVANANASNYVLTWQNVTSNAIWNSNATSNSNITIGANGGAIRFGVANRANAIVISGNATYTSTTLSDDLTVTGNFTVSGNTNYVNINSLSVSDPIINLGVSSNGSPLVAPDGKDRGIVDHFYGANLVTTANGAVSAPANTFRLASVTGAANGQPIFALDANGNAVFASTTVISNVDVANSRITTNANSLYSIANGAQVVLGSDRLNFMGWSQANGEFVFANNVSVNNFVVGYSQLANATANYFRGNLVNGNANIIGDGNNWAINSNNNVNVAANTVRFNSGNIQMGNVGNIHIFGGNANAAVLGVVTLDGSGRISNVAITSGGDGYTIAPTLTVSGANTIPAVLTANINASGTVTAINIVDAGLNYAANSISVGISAPNPRFLKTDGNGNLAWTEVSTTGGGISNAGGYNAAVQFNQNGSLGGSNSFTFNRVTNAVGITNLVISNRAQILGNVLVSSPNISLGPVSNIHITGGSSNTYLKTDGSGNLSWSSGSSLQPFTRFIAPTTANNQQFSSNAIANLGNSRYYNIMKDGIYLEPVVDWTLVNANTIQINTLLRANSVIDILATATDGTLSASEQQASFLRAQQMQPQTLSAPAENLIFDTVTVNNGPSINIDNLTGIVTLQPNIIYKITAEVPTFQVNNQTQVALQLWDITNGAAIGSAAFYYQQGVASDFFSSYGSVTAVIYPLVTTQIALRAVEGVDALRQLTTNTNTDFVTQAKYPWLEIQDVSSAGQAQAIAAGASGSFQFNDGGNIAGTTGITYDKTGATGVTVLGNLNMSVAPVVTLPGVANLRIPGGTVGQTLVYSGSNTLVWGNSTPSQIVNGSSNVAVTANGNVTTSVAGRANVLTVTANSATLSPDSKLVLQGNAGTQVNKVTIGASQDSTGANWTLVLPPTPGNSGYVLGTDGTGVTSWIDTGAQTAIGNLYVWTRQTATVKVNVIAGGAAGLLRVNSRTGSVLVPLA